MTTESVATESTNTKSMPGLEDLLLSLGGLHSHQNPDRIAQAASNALEPVNQGVRAIGEMLWRISAAGKDTFELDKNTMHGIGVLLVHLADFSDQVGFIERNATFIAHDDRNKK